MKKSIIDKWLMKNKEKIYRIIFILGSIFGFVFSIIFLCGREEVLGGGILTLYISLCGFHFGKLGGINIGGAVVDNPLYKEGHFRKNSVNNLLPLHDVKGLFFCQVSSFFLILPMSLYMYLKYQVIYKRYLWIEFVITALSWSIFFIGLLFVVYYTYIKEYANRYYENENGIWMPFSYIDTYYCEGEQYKNFECYYYIEFDEILSFLKEKLIQKGYVLSELKKINESDTIYFYTRYKDNILQIFQILQIHRFTEEYIEKFNKAFEEFWIKNVSDEQSDGKVNFMFLLCVKEYSIKLKKAFRGRIIQKDGRNRLGAVIEFGDYNSLRIMDSYTKKRRTSQYSEMYHELLTLLGLKESDRGKKVYKGYVEEYSYLFKGTKFDPEDKFAVNRNKRKLIVKRKKHFACELVYFGCVVDGTMEEFKRVYNTDAASEYEGRMMGINNGQTISLPIEERACNMFIVAATAAGVVYSNEVYIKEGKENVNYEIRTHYHIFNKTRISLELYEKI